MGSKAEGHPLICPLSFLYFFDSFLFSFFCSYRPGPNGQSMQGLMYLNDLDV
ncbi:hypothetical protein BCR43DRAFT_481734 [Syncephalastrum racemosum]|uniref:Uncharacterized protein n=1 Tax=Syncephalastrum racemosum TaxID=13706 RepID=A0A1X2HSK7_SYNRA|nr:hypothetical protein BCR43DRAFT_481734 [Syncephalastrum racemosum]